MRKAILFIAMSLDGYLADVHGQVDWLSGEEEQADMPDVYGSFIQDIDTILMGWNTYHQVATELSPDAWVYEGMKSYVFTHRELQPKEDVVFTKEAPKEVLCRLKQEPGKDIWICGGASLVGQLLREGLIDRFYITVIPTLLGDGIRLFEAFGEKTDLRLVETRSYNGMVDLVYERR